MSNKTILLNGVDGNFGHKCAETLLANYDHSLLIFAAAYAAMSDWADRVVDVNGAEPLTIGEYIEIANQVTGHQVKYVEINDEERYAFFDSIGVPRTTEQMWTQTAANFPFCSDGMVTFGRAIRLGQMSTFTDDFEKLVGRKPLTVKEIFEHMDEHLIGSRTSTED